MTYSLSGEYIGISSITTKSGKVLLENTMDVYITMQDGSTYYASQSTTPARMNMFKYGYYYYDLHLLDQNFMGNLEIEAELNLQLGLLMYGNHINSIRTRNGVLSFNITGDDPYIYMDSNNSAGHFDTRYTAIQFTMRTTSTTKGEIFFISGNATGHNGEQC